MAVRRTHVVAGAGAGAAMAARTSTAKALAAQIPGFTAASATGATHLIVASAVAGSALVGTAAITNKLEQRPHPPATPAHASTDPRPAHPSSDRSGPAPPRTAGGGALGAANPRGAGQTVSQASANGKNRATGQAPGQEPAHEGAGQATGQAGGQGATSRTTPPPPSGKPATLPTPRQPTHPPSSRSGRS